MKCPRAHTHEFRARYHSLGGSHQLRRGKGGVMLLMKSIAQEVAHLKIRGNALSPGEIRTPINVAKLASPELYEDQLLRLIPYRRISEPEDVARAAVWPASDE